MPADAKRKRDSPALSDTASRPRPAPFASGSGSRDNVATENKDAPPGGSASGGYASPRANDKNQGAAHEMITMGKHLPLALEGSHWFGRRSLQNVVVFGDAHSTPSPDEDAPATWVWVDHLRARLKRAPVAGPIEVHAYAAPGAAARGGGLGRQVARFAEEITYVPTPRGPAPAIHPNKGTYVLFMGIEDCCAPPAATEAVEAEGEIEAAVKEVIAAAEALYARTAARNFVFVDVPPMQRSPEHAGTPGAAAVEARVDAWNAALRRQLPAFKARGEAASVFLVSAHQVLTDVLDDPAEYEFELGDVGRAGGAIWRDGRRLTSEVHAFLAECVLTSLLRARDSRGKLLLDDDSS